MFQHHTLSRLNSMEFETIILMQTFLRYINTKELSLPSLKSWKSVICFQLTSLSTIVFADLSKIRSDLFSFEREPRIFVGNSSMEKRGVLHVST